MKTFKILFAAIIFVAFANTSFAQDPQDNEIHAIATVIQELTFDGEDKQNLNFGVITVNGGKTIDFSGNITGGDDANQVEGVTEGLVSFEAGVNSNITISYASSGEITDNEELDVSYVYSWHYDDEGGAGDNEWTGEANIDGLESSKVWITVGGTINATNALPDVYTDDITITAVYN